MFLVPMTIVVDVDIVKCAPRTASSGQSKFISIYSDWSTIIFDARVTLGLLLLRRKVCVFLLRTECLAKSLLEARLGQDGNRRFRHAGLMLRRWGKEYSENYSKLKKG